MPPGAVILAGPDPERRGLLEQAVRAALPDFNVVHAGSPEEISRLVTDRPQALLLFHAPPAWDALALIAAVKDGGCPILVLTEPDAAPLVRLECVAAGADGCTKWPLDTVDLAARLLALIRAKNAQDLARDANHRLAELAAKGSEALREAEQRYRLLINTCDNPVFAFETAPDGVATRMLEVNDAMLACAGYGREEFLGLDVRELLPADRVESLGVRVESILKHGQVTFESVLKARDGEETPMQVNACALDGPERPVIFCVLRAPRTGAAGEWPPGESDPRFRIVANRTGLLIYDYSLRTGLAHWRGAVTQVTGRLPGELAAIDWRDRSALVHPEDLGRVRAALAAAVEEVGKFAIEYRLLHPSGVYRHVEDEGIALPGDDGRAYRVLGTMKDISERVRTREEERRLEGRVQHAQRLESLGVLAGGIAHDFNNILAAIIGLTDMALLDVPAGSPLHDDLSESLRAAHRAKDLVRQILAFSRQAGEERGVMQLQTVLREALKLARASLPPSISLLDRIEDTAEAVVANAGQIHQVAMNFLTNAAQAMQEHGGTIEVGLRNVNVDEAMAAAHPRMAAGRHVCLIVRDTGHGMAPHVLERIFDPFFTTRRPGEGTGMGLAVVHGIVSDHGGVVTAESAPGQGSIFRAYFPAAPAGAPAQSKSLRDTPRGNGERILFVDDEEPVLRFARKALPQLGYDVTACRDGIEALAAFRKDPDAYSVVVTDQLMPGMNGDVLARELLAIRPDVPVILFTGFSETAAQELAEKAGICEVVMKPILARELAEAIRRALARRAVAARRD